MGIIRMSPTLYPFCAMLLKLIKTTNLIVKSRVPPISHFLFQTINSEPQSQFFFKAVFLLKETEACIGYDSDQMIFDLHIHNLAMDIQTKSAMNIDWVWIQISQYCPVTVWIWIHISWVWFGYGNRLFDDSVFF